MVCVMSSVTKDLQTAKVESLERTAKVLRHIVRKIGKGHRQTVRERKCGFLLWEDLEQTPRGSVGSVPGHRQRIAVLCVEPTYRGPWTDIDRGEHHDFLFQQL